MLTIYLFRIIQTKPTYQLLAKLDRNPRWTMKRHLLTDSGRPNGKGTNYRTPEKALPSRTESETVEELLYLLIRYVQNRKPSERTFQYGADFSF